MEDSGNPLASLLLPVLLLVAFYLLIIRPQRARSKAMQQVQARIGAGAQIVTTSGLYAEVVEADDETLLLEVAPGITNRYSRVSVARVVSGGTDPDVEPELEPEPDPDPPAGPGGDQGDGPPRERPAV